MDLISGASGFIGRHLVKALQADGLPCRLLSRYPLSGAPVVAFDFFDKTQLAAAVCGGERVFHCAGYAHAFSSLSGDDAAKHWQINFEGTKNLVNAAGEAGVKCFVFLSSVKAMAEPGLVCADEEFPGMPETDYGQAKLAAEQAVLRAGEKYGMQVVNLRLAMVYGAGGRGNLERMAGLVARGFFPPLPETGNHRSLVHVDDVISAMRLVASDPRASGGTFIVASEEAPSGRALFDALREAQGLPECHWSVPAGLLRLTANLADFFEKMLKRRLPFDSEVLARLLNSAWYSPSRIEQVLGWRAKTSLVDGLREMLKK
ncbi:MAG: NAD-dependent epimerase/dehydratase family protein [Rhodocyclaceae bacterium]|nr:NAD-dependent epimerase/dehydratase family protein [Rhodocyclaceae bacterium]